MKLKFDESKHEGLLITFCGLDGCGKSTLINLINNYLTSKSYNTLLTKQPTKEFRNTVIFRNVQDTPDHTGYDYRAMALMAAADRLQHCINFIIPALRLGKIVICDRYYYSCLANLRARNYINDEWIYEIAHYIPKPDLAFFLDIEVDMALQRVRSRPEEMDKFVNVGLQHKLKDEYLQIARKNGGVVIRTDCSLEESFLEIKRKIASIGFC